MTAPAPTAEVEALILCARRELDAVSREGLRERLRGGLDWDALVGLGRKHGLLPLLARHLESVAEDAPPGLLESLRPAAAAVARRNLGLLAELFRALDRLDAAGVAAVPLKGPLLAIALYGDLGLREFTDLDVLVPRDDAFRARDALADLGYVPVHWLPADAEGAVLETGNALALERPEACVCLEVHWRFFPRHSGFPLETTGPLERLEAVEVQGRRLTQLGAEDRLLFLAAHGFRHAWERLEWIGGLAELVRRRPDLDWDAALDRARGLGGTRMLGLGLHLAATDLAAPVPAPVLAATADEAVTELAERVRARWRSGETEPLPRGEETRFRLRGRERRRDRLRYLVQVVATPSEADWRVARLGRRLAPLYTAIRLVRLSAKYAGRAARRAWPGA